MTWTAHKEMHYGKCSDSMSLTSRPTLWKCKSLNHWHTPLTLQWNVRCTWCGPGCARSSRTGCTNEGRAADRLAVGSIQVQGRHLCEQAEMLSQLQGGQTNRCCPSLFKLRAPVSSHCSWTQSRDSDGKRRVSGKSTTIQEEKFKKSWKAKVENATKTKASNF